MHTSIITKRTRKEFALSEKLLPDFLSQYIDREPGKILTTEGKVVGTHSGVQFFTVGQRQGLGVALNIPHYVAAKDVKTNAIVLAPENNPVLYQKEIAVSSVNFINRDHASLSFAIPKSSWLRVNQPYFTAMTASSSAAGLSVKLR